MSSNSSLSDFGGGSTAQDSTTETNDDNWPLQANGHLIERFTPSNHMAQTGDSETALRCKRCGETVYLPENRSVPLGEWARNRFSLTPCSTGSENIV